MKKFLRIISAVVVTLIALSLLLTGCVSQQQNENDDNDLPNGSDKTNELKFSNNDEFIKYLSENLTERYYAITTETVDGVLDSLPTATDEDAVSDFADSVTYADQYDVSETNRVDENVDEGDILKTDGKYIYVIRNNELIILSAADSNTEVLSYYKIFPTGDGYVKEMYIKGDTALIVANIWATNNEEYFEGKTNFGYTFDPDAEDQEPSTSVRTPSDKFTTCTAVFCVDISDRTSPKESFASLVEGDYVSSREKDGKMYLVANKIFYSYDYDEPDMCDFLPYVYNSEQGFYMMDASDIYRPVLNYVSSSVMSVAIIDWKNGGKTDVMSVLGAGSKVYMTADSFYIINYDWTNTNIAKYSVNDTLEYVASVSVPGKASTAFSYNEYNGKFRIATTDSVTSSNSVYVYDRNLEKIGELTGLAAGEKIYSVRFSGDVAYVVTFRQVDPLFVIDMSENTPKVLGELKVPGFSTYLHPVADGLLLGIGKETKENVWTDYYGQEYVSTYVAGMKISLFDVSDPFEPKEIDVINMVGGSYATSEALSNYKAFVYSDAEQTGYFPIFVSDGYGFACVHINEDDKLECKIIVPETSGYSNYPSYSRVCYVNDSVYFYQYDTMTVYDRTTLTETATVIIK